MEHYVPAICLARMFWRFAKHGRIHVFQDKRGMRQLQNSRRTARGPRGYVPAELRSTPDVRVDRIHLLFDDPGCPDAPCRIVDARGMMLGRTKNDVKAYVTSHMQNIAIFGGKSLQCRHVSGIGLSASACDARPTVGRN